MRKFLMALFFLFPGSLTVLYAKEYKIATIDMKRVMNEYKDLQDARREIFAYEKEWIKVRDSLLAEIQKLKEELKKKIPMLTPQGIMDEEEKISDLEKQYRQYIKRIWGENGEYSKKLKELTRPYLEKLHETISKLARESGYDLVLDRSSNLVIYASNENDITEDVLDYLNKEYVVQSQTGIKKKICVLPFLEKDKDVKNLGLGNRAEDVVVASLKKSPNFDVLPSGSVRQKMTAMGIRMETLTESQGVQVATALNADYFIMGEVYKDAMGIHFKMYLYDSRTIQKINEVEGLAENAEELFDQSLANKARELITPIIPKKQ